MAKNIFEMSKDGKSEYCIDVIKVGTLIPIEGSDFLAQTSLVMLLLLFVRTR